MANPKNIIAVGGGKGGIGKSLLSANLAVGLALGGYRVVLADTDYGASNLHALLGIVNPRLGLRDLIHYQESDPGNLLMDTGVGNLKFLSGAGDLSGSFPLSREANQNIISIIAGLDADYVVVDLGPGVHSDTLERFNLASTGIVLTLPEIPSVMNAFSFIKSVLFKKIQNALPDGDKTQELFRDSASSGGRNERDELCSLDDLKEKAALIDPNLVLAIDEATAKFKPNLVVNRVRKKKDLLAGDNLAQLAKKYLNVNLNFLGFIIESDRVRDSVDEMIPFLIKDPQSKPSENLQQILGNLTQTDLYLVKKDGVIFSSKRVALSSDWKV